ncbi:MAG: M23 family metallopeptidase [Candidatus Peribacteraceae bacterium]|nr:M23 family metallopeptidase [Candidatus Peribacteraceae bacterium]MDD5742687.1 M23 family metallopeptidase [Candidatus Peribacteraceae bacterium]
MTQLVSRKKLGFGATPLHRHVEPHAFHFLAQRKSFWVAILSLLAFVTGNMIGQHGWQVFWKSVMGHDNDSLIVYTGTVTPIALVPDYTRWKTYGGNAEDHTYREVPQDLLIALPPYSAALSDPKARAIYSVSYMGSYTTGQENSGSHPAVDIRVPIGTPVRSIAAGIVSEVKDATGFGKTVVIRHPNIPDPSRPTQSTVLYSNYAHLSVTYVKEGDIVEKGEQIALSGMTGDATGPHLHFQIDRGDAPWHPYWPFTSEELRAAGYSTTQAVNRGFHADRGTSFTVNPLLYVQAGYAPVLTVVQAASAGSARSSASSISSQTWLSRVQARIAQRRAEYLALQPATTVAVHEAANASSLSSAPQTPPPSSEAAGEVVQRREVVVSRDEELPPAAGTPVASVEITHDGSYSDRGWERVRLTLLDARGNVVTSPMLTRDIVLRASFGSADFQPDALSVLDFANGRAEVSVLPHGRRTLIIEAMPFGSQSQPMRYAK